MERKLLPSTYAAIKAFIDVNWSADSGSMAEVEINQVGSCITPEMEDYLNY
jgi:hypothetical protein